MKLATYRDGSRNGQLVVVSRDLSLAHYATGAAHTLQQALDDWSFIAPQLQDLSLALNRGRAPHPFAFDPAMCLAPLPRASQCLRGAACASHRDTVLAAGLLPFSAHSATAGASRPGRAGGRAQRENALPREERGQPETCARRSAGSVCKRERGNVNMATVACVCTLPLLS